MKYIKHIGTDKETNINPFEDDKVLGDLCSKWDAMERVFKQEDMPVHEENIKEYFKENYSIQFEEEEVTELRGFMVDERVIWMENLISDDFNSGAEIVNTKKFGIDE